CNHMSVGGLPISADTGRTSSPRIAACLAETADVARVVGLRCSFLLPRVCVRRVLFAIGRPGRTARTSGGHAMPQETATDPCASKSPVPALPVDHVFDSTRERTA